MKMLLTSIIKALVDTPSAVKISQIQGAKSTIFEIRCDDRDVGKVIGKSGKTVGALRTLFNSLASKEGAKPLWKWLINHLASDRFHRALPQSALFLFCVEENGVR